MTPSIFESDFTVEKTFSGNVLESIGYGCESEHSCYSDQGKLSGDSGFWDDLQEADSHVESEQFYDDKPHDNDLMSFPPSGRFPYSLALYDGFDRVHRC